MSKVGNFFKMCGIGVLNFFKNLPGNILKFLRYIQRKQLLIPLLMLVMLIIFDIILDKVVNNTSFFTIFLRGDRLQGTIPFLLDNATKVVILAIGMTFVTSACGGQDISIGAVVAIGGAMSISMVSFMPVIIAFFVGVVVVVAFTAFNGLLVSRFKLLPMVATLILFTCGRDIAAAIGGNGTVLTSNASFGYAGNVIPGFPIQMPIIITIICVIAIFVVLKFSNLRLYTESVGINSKAARLNGINPERIKMLSFIILGVCVGIVGFIEASRSSMVRTTTIALGVELDVILAVAIGGTMLGGGKFNLAGSIIGAYTIQLINYALDSFKIQATSQRAYKAIVVIILVVIGSPVVREKLSAFFNKFKNFVNKRKENSIAKEGV